MRLPYTRAMLTAALEGQLDHVPMEPHGFFKTMVPKACPHVPPDFLDPRGMWSDKTAYDRAALELSALFARNFEKFSDVSPEVLEAGPLALARV
jgi:phosphoenolpyruvate carboxykinase (ATP)